jgi:hypothetical protein
MPILKIGIFIFLLFNSSYTFAQSRREPRGFISRGGTCESNAASFDALHALVQDNSSIIAIAKLGNSENSTIYNLRRLKAIKEYFSQTHPEYYKILVTAHGERIKGRGQVEIYVNGVLDLVFEFSPKQDFKIGNCGY